MVFEPVISFVEHAIIGAAVGSLLMSVWGMWQELRRIRAAIERRDQQ